MNVAKAIGAFVQGDLVRKLVNDPSVDPAVTGPRRGERSQHGA